MCTAQLQKAPFMWWFWGLLLPADAQSVAAFPSLQGHRCSSLLLHRANLFTEVPIAFQLHALS